MDVHRITIGDFVMDVPMRQVGNVRIAYLDYLTDRRLVDASARGLVERLPDDGSAIVVPAASAISLGYLLATMADRELVVLRKDQRAHMGETLGVPVQSVTSSVPEMLHLECVFLASLRTSGVTLVDTVTSSGSTLQAMKALMDLAEVPVRSIAVAFTEGDQVPDGVIALGNLPVVPVPAAS